MEVGGGSLEGRGVTRICTAKVKMMTGELGEQPS